MISYMTKIHRISYQSLFFLEIPCSVIFEKLPALFPFQIDLVSQVLSKRKTIQLKFNEIH